MERESLPSARNAATRSSAAPATRNGFAYHSPPLQLATLFYTPADIKKNNIEKKKKERQSKARVKKKKRVRK